MENLFAVDRERDVGSLSFEEVYWATWTRTWN